MPFDNSIPVTHESQLDVAQICPLMTADRGPDLRPRSQAYAVAVKLLKWALVESFSGAIPGRRILRERFTAVWKSTYYPEIGKVPPAHHPQFWKGPRLAAGVAARIHGFLNKYEVAHPEQVYTMFGSGVTDHSGFIGEYALVRRKTGTQYYVLCYHQRRPISAPAPTASEIIRYLHASRTLAPRMLAPRQIQTTLGIYHLVLMRGESWKNDTVNDQMASQIRIDALSSLRVKLPSAGGHCKHCLLKDCMKIWTK